MPDDCHPRFSFRSRQECHDTSFAKAAKRNEQSGNPPPKPRKCKTNRWKPHCECFSGKSKLHQRLKTWMPRGLNYCGQCHMFTRRKRSHNGRCRSTCPWRLQKKHLLIWVKGFHGRPKPRRQEPKYWTHYSRRGAFGRKLWKKWFNNAHMNAFEKKLGMQRGRDGTNRYSLRTLKPKEVDTREIRYSGW